MHCIVTNLPGFTPPNLKHVELRGGGREEFAFSGCGTLMTIAHFSRSRLHHILYCYNYCQYFLEDDNDDNDDDNDDD